MGVWLVVWNMMFFPFSWECHHPNWRTPSFFRGVGQPPTRLCGVMYGTWHIPTCSCFLLTIPLLDVFFRICWWLMGPMMFHPSVDSKVCISSKVSSRYPPGVLQKWVFPPKSSHEFRWFSPWEFMGLSPMFGPKDPKSSVGLSEHFRIPRKPSGPKRSQNPHDSWDCPLWGPN